MSAGSFSGAESRKCDAGRSSIADSCPAPSSQVPLYWALDPSRARRIHSVPTNKPTWTRKRSLRTRAREPTSRPQRAPRPRIAEDNEVPGSDLTSFEGVRTLGHVVVGGELPALGWLSAGPHQRPSPLFSGSSTALSHVGLRNRFEEYREAPRAVFIPIGFL